MNVTSRTIRNDLTIIETHLEAIEGVELISIRGRGYKIHLENQRFLNNIFDEIGGKFDFIPIEPIDRINFILEKMLFTPRYIKIEELMDELYVSRSTIQNDLKDVKVMLKKFNLSIKKRPNYGMKIIGDEKNKRFAISEILISRDTSRYINSVY